MFVKKINGEYFLYRGRIMDLRGRKKRRPRHIYNWWLVKANMDNQRKSSYYCGVIPSNSSNITLPKELVGKRIRFKVEVLK